MHRHEQRELLGSDSHLLFYGHRHYRALALPSQHPQLSWKVSATTYGRIIQAVQGGLRIGDGRIVHSSYKPRFVRCCRTSPSSYPLFLTQLEQLSIALYTVALLRLPKFNHAVRFLLSFGILVVPLLLAITLFADTPARFSIYLSIPILLLSLIPKRENGTPLPSSSPMETKTPRWQPSLAPLPALTTYRAHMLLLTSLSILAVDFPIFPRMLAKCETYGVSLVCYASSPSQPLNSHIR